MTAACLCLAWVSVSAVQPEQITAHDYNKRLTPGVNLGLTFETQYKFTQSCVHPQKKWAPPLLSERFLDLIEEADFMPKLKRFGFSSIRLPVPWDRQMGCHPGARIDTHFLQRVKQVVERAVEAGLVVIIDVHKFNDMNIDMRGQLPRLRAIWTQLSEAFGDFKPGEVYFEVLNEPKPKIAGDNKQGTEASRLWHRVVADIVALIRASGGYNAARPLLVAALHPNETKTIEKLEIPDLKNNGPLIVVVHYYDPFYATHGQMLCQQAIDKKPDLKSTSAERDKAVDEACTMHWLETPRGCERTEKQKANNTLAISGPDCWRTNNQVRLERVSFQAKRLNSPIALNEFGFEAPHQKTWKLSGHSKQEFKRRAEEDRSAWTRHVRCEAERLGFSWFYWNLFASYGIDVNQWRGFEETSLYQDLFGFKCSPQK